MTRNPIRLLHRASLMALLLLLACGPLMPGLAIAAEGESQPEQSASTQAEDPAAEATAVAVHVGETVARDVEIQRVLRARFSLVEPLREIDIEVSAGVVVLRGAVDDDARRDLAMRLAQSVPGVIAVEDRLEFETALERRLQPAVHSGWERLKRLLRGLPLLGVALVIVYLFHLLGRLVTRWERPFRRFEANPFLRDLLQRALRAGILLAGVLVALDLLGATRVVGAVLGAAGVMGLALGFAFRDLVENYIASILLSLRQPFAPNDLVVIGGNEGRVAALNSRATILITPEGNHLRLANAFVFKSVILNYTRNPTRRFSFDLGIGSREDLRAAKRIAVAALAETPGILQQPPPRAQVQAIGDSSVSLRCLGWVDQHSSNFSAVRSEALIRVKEALEAAGMDLPEPTYRVQLQGGEGLPSPALASVLARPLPSRGAASGEEGESAAEDSVEHYLAEQVEIEQRAQGEQNLLRTAAPKE
jgi:small conductance mechanosensitive channel